MTVFDTNRTTGRLKSLRAVIEGTNGFLSADEVVGAKVRPSGFPALDGAMTDGFRAGELALLGGGPGLGKTTFALGGAQPRRLRPQRCLLLVRA